MFLAYLIFFIVINVTSCVHIPDEMYPRGTSAKTFTRKNLNAKSNSGPLLKSSTDDSPESKVMNENYFPDVIYPTNILDVAQPFFYKVNAYDEVLGPFSEDVKSSYKYISSYTKKATSKNVTPNYDEEILKNVSLSQIVHNLDIVNADEDISEISKCNESYDENISAVSSEDNYYDVNIIEQRIKESETYSNSPFSLFPCSNETDSKGGEEFIEKIYNETMLYDKQECDDDIIVDSEERTNSGACSNIDDEDSLKKKSKLKSDNTEVKVPIDVKIRIEVFRNVPGKQIFSKPQDIDSVSDIIVVDSMNKEKSECFVERSTILRNIDLIDPELKLFENKFASINETSFDDFNYTLPSSLIELFKMENITDVSSFSSIEKLSRTTNDSLIDIPINIDSVLNIIVDNPICNVKNESYIERRTILPNIDLIQPELKLFENKYATINKFSFDDLNGTVSSSSIELFGRENITDDTSFSFIEKLLPTTDNSLVDLPSTISNYNDSNYSASFSEEVSKDNATDVYTVPLVIYLKSNSSIDCGYNDTYMTNISNSSVQDEDFFLDFVISLDNLCETNTTEWQDDKNLTNLYVIENSREVLSDDLVPEARFNNGNITLYSINSSREDD